MSTDNERTPLIQHHDQRRSSGSITPSSSMTACANGAAKNIQQARSTKRKLWFAVSLACMFFVTELVAGYFANSLGKVSLFPS